MLKPHKLAFAIHNTLDKKFVFFSPFKHIVKSNYNSSASQMSIQLYKREDIFEENVKVGFKLTWISSEWLFVIIQSHKMATSRVSARTLIMLFDLDQV